MNKTNKILVISFFMALAFSINEASALPVFARQTGLTCMSCHFQHFPLLNSNGRAFKNSGYTWKGKQEVIEGENISIPAVLNFGALVSAGYEKNNSTSSVTSLKNSGNGIFFFPGNNGEASLFFGGRVSDFSGFLAELGLAGTGTTLGSAKLPLLVDLKNEKRAGVVFFSTDDQGASYGFETMNTGANAIHQMSNTPGFNRAHTKAISAQQYINTAGVATGASFVANAEKFFINITKYNQVGITGTPDRTSSGARSSALNSTYARIAGFFYVNTWDAGVGVQSWSGNSADGKGNRIGTRATAIDAQLQGTLSNLPLGIYASYARAPAIDVGNTYNVDANGIRGTATRSSFNLSSEFGVLPDKGTIGIGFRLGKSGQLVDGHTNASDNAIFATATYKILQNMLARISYTTESGDYWNFVNKSQIGNHTTTINLYTLF